MYAKDLKHHLKKGTPPSDHAFITLVAGLDKLTKTTEDFNVDKICSLAMKSIIHGSGFSHFEYKCADTLDTLMDQMDLTSKYYKTINFRLLYGSLRLIQNNTNLLLEQRTSAGNVLRFVELFM
ncbi:hypothetical protein CAEBREN_13433 [Caenorhabditis brenneri]|uniref:Uncharacterized protein n=1 Tax=Caenorhabditis brenneri TaxID=135651 RepID=G0MBC4_CAEBE|nr:hypothetical protein CAEBREN_13433 [Caenorhabditis brenneri]